MISKVELVNFKVKSYTENFLPHSKKLHENQQDTFQKNKKLNNALWCNQIFDDSVSN